MFLETIHSLAKRGDSDIGGVPKWALVILIMIAAGVGVVMCYGLFRFMTPENPTLKPLSPEQADYMREVRDRSLNGLRMESAQYGPPHRHRQSNRR